ncbi:MAG: thiamine pyrophosphate-dependent enzyme [Dehalococcoidales bacterium]|nr:thiamine pyrophosphate-dependent enzyme [Dehalococcoidales bacterium]
MMLQELETAVRLQLSIVCLVFCDRKLGLIDVVQKRRLYPACGVDFGGTDLAAIARGFGAHGVKAASFSELETAIADGLRMKGPVVIEVPIDPEEYAKQM